tara:strand:+ start:262 stop:1380 length:1119 start_codon:yes stop_codon:yes gene_type:complete
MKITVVGAGNAGCFTALWFAWFGRKENVEVELIYNPEIPVERVGQATLLNPPAILWGSTGFNWYNNNIHATFKSGILYENWGKKNDKIFHEFAPDLMAMHYCPWEMQKSILNSGHFKVTEGDVDPKDVDADYVFDCRGKPKDFTGYKTLKNPINAAILAKPNWDVTKAFWSRHVATPDGWTFVIPTHPDSPSHDYCVGYCYNTSVTTKKEAEKNFTKLFDVDVKKHVGFINYVVRDPIVDDRIILNGNRLFFLEPMESSSVQTYIEWIKMCWDYIFNKTNPRQEIVRYIEQTQNFVLWHYQFGSKYDTPFWDYAKTLTFKDNEFDNFLKYSRQLDKYDILPKGNLYGGMAEGLLYSQWPPYSFKRWDDGMNK